MLKCSEFPASALLSRIAVNGPLRRSSIFLSSTGGWCRPDARDYLNKPLVVLSGSTSSALDDQTPGRTNMPPAFTKDPPRRKGRIAPRPRGPGAKTLRRDHPTYNPVTGSSQPRNKSTLTSAEDSHCGFDKDNDEKVRDEADHGQVTGNTALHEAAYYGWHRVVEDLIASGEISAIIDQHNEPLQETALHIAVKRNHYNITVLLLDAGADVNVKSRGLWTPTHIAVDAGHEDIVKLLVERGANLDFRTTSNRRPVDLAMAVKRDDLAALVKPRSMRKKGESLHNATPPVRRGSSTTPWVDYLDSENEWWTLLHSAARDNDLALVKALAEAERAEQGKKKEEAATQIELSSSDSRNICDTVFPNPKSVTPLHVAVLRCHHEVMAYFVTEKVFHVDCEDIQDRTPLHVAVDNSNPSETRALMIRFLLAHGADPFRLCDVGRNAVSYAARWRLRDILKEMLAPYTEQKVLKAKLAAMPRSLLHSAVESGDAEIVQTVLDLDVLDVNSKTDYFLKTPLYVATTSGQVEICRLLLAHGADANMANKDGWGPVHLWCRQATGDPEHQALLDLLIDHGGSIDQPTRDGWGCFHIACQAGCPETIRNLIKRGIDIHQTTQTSWDAMHVAAHRGDVEVLRLLLDAGCSPSTQTLDGWTPLHIACHANEVAAVRFLVQEAKVKVSVGSYQGWTAIHHVAQVSKGDTEMLKILLHPQHPDEKGPDGMFSLEAANVGGWNALHIAAHYGYTNFCRTLIDHGAEMDSLTPDKGWTPLHLAVDMGRLETVRLLIDRGANRHTIDPGFRTLCHTAVQKGHAAVLELLLSAGCNMSSGDNQGWTPLHCAAASGAEDCLAVLLQYCTQEDLEVPTSHLRTPMSLAAAKGQASCISMLLAAGASCRPATVTNATGGWLPIHSVSDRGYEEATRVLLHHDISQAFALTTQRKSAMHLAAGHGAAGIVAMHLDAGLEVDITCSHGWTALHYASQLGRTEVVRLLLERGASLALANGGHWTALHIAAAKGFVDIVKLMVSSNRPDLPLALRMLTNKRYTALDLARLNPALSDVREVLRAAGCQQQQKFVTEPGTQENITKNPTKASRKQLKLLDRLFEQYDIKLAYVLLGRHTAATDAGVDDMILRGRSVGTNSHGSYVALLTPTFMVADWLHIRFGYEEGILNDPDAQLLRYHVWALTVEQLSKQARYKTYRNLHTMSDLGRLQRAVQNWLSQLQEEVFPILRDRAMDLDGRLILTLKPDRDNGAGDLVPASNVGSPLPPSALEKEKSLGGTGIHFTGDLHWHCHWLQEETRCPGPPKVAGTADKVFRRLIQWADTELTRRSREEEKTADSMLQQSDAVRV